MKEYIIPVGIDGSKIINPLEETINKMEAVSGVAKETGKSLNEAFANGSRSVDSLDEKLKPITKGLDAVKVLGRQAGKELADAFNNKNINPSALEKAVAGFRSKLDGLGRLNIEIDDAQLKILDKQLSAATNEVQELAIAADFARSVLEQLDPNSAEFAQLSEGIAYTEAAIDEFANTVDQTTGKQKTLKAELRAVKNELAAMEEAGMAGTQSFRELQVRAGQLEDQIGDTNAQVKILASDTAKFDGLISGVQGLVGGFTAVQGAAALFGDESEALQETLLKVNGAMAVLQGLQAVSETLNKDSAFSVIYLSRARTADAAATASQTTATVAQTAATKAATVATKTMGFALKALGIGLIITAIAYLVENWDDLKASLNKVLPAGQSVEKMFDRMKSVAFGVGNAIVQYIVGPIKAVYYATQGEWQKAQAALLAGLSATSNYRDAFNKQNARNDQKYRDEQERKNIDFAKRELERRRNRGEDVFKLEQRLRAREIAFNKRTGAETAEIQKEYEDAADRHYAELSKKREADGKKAADDAKKRAEDAAKRAEELRKARAEEAKKNADLIKKFTEEQTQLEIESMEEGLEKQLKIIEAGRKSKIDSIKEEGATSAAAIEAQNKLIAEINSEAIRKRQEAEKANTEAVLKLRLEGNKMLQELSLENVDRDLELSKYESEARIADIKERFKTETDLRSRLLEQEAEYSAKKAEEIRLKYAQKAIADEEERLILTVELSSLYAGKSEKVEEQKQLAIMSIKAEYAQKSLDALLASGKDENDLEILKARKLVQDMKKAVEDEAAKGKKFDFFEFVGLDISKDQKEAVIKAGNEMMNAVSSITEVLVDKYQEQIDKKQEVIDQIDDEIGDLESRLEDEKDLRENGFANNVEIIEKELAAKKAQRDEELRQQEEMIEKKKQMQKTQMAVDTAMQLVNLITASTEIFKSLAAIPFVGVPLAIATIGVMFGAFAVAKAKAFQSIKDGQKFRKGGWIDGPSHEGGGVKYYSEDGRNIELEGKEFVVKKEAARKYRGLLQAINDGDFAGLTVADVGLKALFEDLGISFDTETVAEAVGDAKTLKNLESGVSVNVNSNNEYFRRMNENIGFLASQKRDEIQTWEDDEYYYTKRGTKTTKKRKTK